MNTPRLIILGGFAGAGKTTLAKRLAAQYQYPLFASDEINTTIRTHNSISFHDAAPLAHSIMWDMAIQQISLGVSCILDTNMCSQRAWDNIDALKQTNIEVQIIPILLYCTLDVHTARIKHREIESPDHLNLGGDELQDVLHKYEYISSLQRDDIIRISANGTKDEVYTSVVELPDKNI